MTDGKKVTGTRDEHYNLVSVLYHALQAGETYEQYISDAQQANDDELVEFFRGCQKEDKERSDRAKELLGKRLAG